MQRNSLNIPWTYSQCKLVRLSANQSIANNTQTQLILGSTAYVKGTDLTNDAANNQIIVNRYGVYVIGAYCVFDGNATGRRFITIMTNGSGRGRVELGPTSASANWEMHVSTMMPLNPGDTITAEVLQTSGGSLAIINTTYTCYLAAFRVC